MTNIPPAKPPATPPATPKANPEANFFNNALQILNGLKNPINPIAPTAVNSKFNPDELSEIFQQINDNVSNSSNFSNLSSLANAFSSFNLAKIGHENTLAQIKLQEIAAMAQAETGLQTAALREIQLLSLTAIENQVLMDQYREKLLNMRAEVVNAKLNNAWTRNKNIASAFKY
jgi:hypothetical protein